MNIDSGEARLVLLCPAWRKYGSARTVKPDTVILHSRADDVVRPPYRHPVARGRPEALRPVEQAAVAEHGHQPPVPDDLDAELAKLLDEESGPGGQ